MPFSTARLMAVAALAAAACAGQPAAAQETKLSPADLAGVMAAYADAVVDMRDLYKACAPNPPGGWDEGAAMLVESLRAAGLDAAAVSAIADRLASAAPAEPVDCAAPEHALRAGLAAGTDWPAYHRAVLEAAGVQIVLSAAGDERLAAARAAVEKALPAQARMLECLSLFDPRSFVLAYGDWDRLVETAAGHFAAAGYAAGTYGPILEPAAASRLFKAPVDRKAATASCAADQAWYERYSIMAWFTFAGDIEAALKGGQP